MTFGSMGSILVQTLLDGLRLNPEGAVQILSYPFGKTMKGLDILLIFLKRLAQNENIMDSRFRGNDSNEYPIFNKECKTLK